MHKLKLDPIMLNRSMKSGWLMLCNEIEQTERKSIGKLSEIWFENWAKIDWKSERKLEILIDKPTVVLDIPVPIDTECMQNRERDKTA